MIIAAISLTTYAQPVDSWDTVSAEPVVPYEWEEIAVLDAEEIPYSRGISAIEIGIITMLAAGLAGLVIYLKKRKRKGSPRKSDAVEILEYTSPSALPKGYMLRGCRYDYIIKSILGQGSFGITYLAYTKQKNASGEYGDNTLVAIKEFYMKDVNGRSGTEVTCSSQNGIYEKYKAKFAKEAQLIQTLSYPGIIKVADCFAANNTFYYAMEYIEGGSLNEYIEICERIPESATIKYIRSIGKALAYMHKHNIVHLDIKPSNIMIGKGGNAVIIDFGLSKQYDDNGIPESSTSIGGGTPGYAPIEQSTFHSSDDLPVTMDIYALGATMFKMLTGSRPPEASAILNEGFPRAELQRLNISESTIASIEKAMAPTKKNRYQTINAFLNALSSETTVII